MTAPRGVRISNPEIGAGPRGSSPEGEGRYGEYLFVLKSLAGVGAVALGALVAWTIPGSAVPQSGQTLAVLLVGAALGLRAGVFSLTLYILLGALGLPIFADGAAGWRHLVGPTAGYLVGFVAAAGLVGRSADRGRLSRAGSALSVMLVGHVLILGLGWLRLSFIVGAAEALATGVLPFIWGGAVKSFVAALLVVGATHRAGALRKRSSAS